jgi:glutamine amidotransferase
MLVVVVDTGFANHHSVQKAIEEAGAEGASVQVLRTSDPEQLVRGDKILVPGQGGFKDCVEALAGGLGDALLERLRAGTPFLGICLGLQALFEESDEAPGVRGLGFFEGRVEALERQQGLKIPHMGWNQLRGTRSEHPLLGPESLDDWFYFVHSFHAVPADSALVLATVDYGPNQITAAVGRDNVVATQFHPEKSQAAGLALLKRFLEA